MAVDVTIVLIESSENIEKVMGVAACHDLCNSFGGKRTPRELKGCLGKLLLDQSGIH